MVYFIQNANTKAVKIGTSRDPMKRIAGFQTAIADPLEIIGVLPGDRRLERQLHDRFSRHHLRGEWFKGEPGLLNAIKAILTVSDGHLNVWDEVVRRNGSDFGLIGLYVTVGSERSSLEIVETEWDDNGQLLLTLSDARRRFAHMCSLRSFWPKSFREYDGSPVVVSHGAHRDVTISGHSKPIGMTDDEFREILREAANLIIERLNEAFKKGDSV